MKTKLKQTIFPILMVSLVIAGSILYFNQGMNRHLDKNSPLLKYKFSPGNTVSYNIDYKSTGIGEIVTPSGSITKSSVEKYQSNLHLKANLFMENIAINKDNDYLVEYLIKPSKLDFSFSNRIINKPESIKVSVVMHANGVIKTFHMDSDAFELYGNIIRELLAVLEFSVPENAVLKWSVVEKNIIKEQLANYRINNPKNKDSVYAVDKTYQNNTNNIELSGGFVFAFNNQKGLVESIEGTKKQVFSFAGKNASTSESSLSIKLINTGLVTRSPEYISTAWNKIKRNVEENLVGDKVVSNMEERANLEVLGKDDLSTLTDKLAQVDNTDHSKLTKLVQKLTALLELRPELADELAALLNDYQWQDGQWGAIAATLTYVGTKQAQVALINALDNATIASQTHQNLMPHLAFVDKPIVEAENYFRNLKQSTQSEEVAYKSNNALGIIASNLRENDKPRSMAIYNELSSELQAAQESYQKVRLIEAIGNIGLSEQTQLLQDYIQNSDNDIKIPAIYSLRFINTAESRNLLTGYLVDDDQKVRESAALALDFATSDASVLAVYEQRLTQERSIPILKSIIKNLAKMSTVYPRSLELIDSFIKTCANRDICGYAKNIRSMRT